VSTRKKPKTTQHIQLEQLNKIDACLDIEIPKMKNILEKKEKEFKATKRKLIEM